MEDHDQGEAHGIGQGDPRRATPAKPRSTRAHPRGVRGVWRAGRRGVVDGALDAKTKELIALAIAVTKQCDGCTASHARGAARRGATPQEVAEALGVAILMNGGPGTVHAPRAFAAFQEFAART